MAMSTPQNIPITVLPVNHPAAMYSFDNKIDIEFRFEHFFQSLLWTEQSKY